MDSRILPAKSVAKRPQKSRLLTGIKCSQTILLIDHMINIVKCLNKEKTQLILSIHLSNDTGRVCVVQHNFYYFTWILPQKNEN